MRKTALILGSIMLILAGFCGQGKALVLPADKIMRISTDFVEFEHHGILSVSAEAEAYQHWEGENWPMPLDGVKVGFQEVVVTLEQDEVVRFDVYDPLYIRTIRVALSTENFSGIEHERLTFTPTSRLFVEETGTGRGFIVEEGEEAQVFAEDNRLFFQDGQGVLWEFDRRLYLWPDPAGLIQINTFQRGISPRFFPRYRGRIELTVVSSARFLAINEISLEEYLYQVVPSEMPRSWPAEALKAQAVAARTFAVAQAVYSRQGHLGFHVSDSTSSQVYNNQPEAEEAAAAIEATAGQILTKEDGTIGSTYFYCASPGGPLLTMADWNNTGALALEGNCPLFRWRCSFTKDELDRLLGAALPAVGKIVKIEVDERDQWGRVAALKVEGTEGVARLEGELNIRSVLRPSRVELSQGAQSVSLLPSAFFVLAAKMDQAGQLTELTLYGGGSGHGLGMSQWGAKGMAEAGSDYLSILEKYYPRTRLITHSERLRY